MSKIKKLRVIECPYGGEVWLVDKEGNIHSEEMNVIAGPREVDDYENCGVYLKAGVPYERQDVPYELKEGELSHQAIAKGYSDACYQALTSGEAVLLAGGFCANNVGAIGGTQRAYGKDAKIGIVWLDAHGDAATPETSKSGLYNGMPVTTLMGQCLEHWAADAKLEKSIEGKHILMGDLRDTSEEQLEHLKKSGVHIVDTEAFHTEGVWESKVNALAEEVDVLLLHVDIDVLPQENRPSYPFPTGGGVEIDIVTEAMKSAVKTGKVAVMTMLCVHFDDHLDGQDITNLSAMRMLGATLSVWKEYPKI